MDIIAGITLAALAIPEVMGYAKIAGVPVVLGLYTLLIPIAVFALFGSSRHLVVGADSATADYPCYYTRNHGRTRFSTVCCTSPGWLPFLQRFY